MHPKLDDTTQSTNYDNFFTTMPILLENSKRILSQVQKILAN